MEMINRKDKVLHEEKRCPEVEIECSVCGEKGKKKELIKNHRCIVELKM